MVRKQKSSALLIAILIGILMSGLVIGVAAVMSGHIKLAGQSREGRLAYRAALSGIEEGLLELKYAKANSTLSSLYGKSNKGDLAMGDPIQPDPVKYELSFATTFNNTSSSEAEFAPWSSMWPTDEQIAKAKKVNIDDTLDIDLTEATHRDSAVGQITIYFSGVYDHDGTKLTNNFDALNYTLLDLSKNQNTGTEKQIVNGQNKTNGSSVTYKIDLDLTYCADKSTECHLRIKPQVTQINSRSQQTRRFAGDTAGSGRYAFIAVSAKNSAGNILYSENPEDLGVITVNSIGTVGQAVRKLTAKVDASSGAYLGLFEFGVYCGTKCTGLTPDQPE